MVASQPKHEHDQTEETEETEELVGHVGELLRLAAMSRELLGELRGVQLDQSGRERMSDIYDRTVTELRDLLPEGLETELDAVVIPPNDQASEQELRLAQAQLVGWLEGLFRGIQAALQAQQLRAGVMQQLRESGDAPPEGATRPEQRSGPGQYL